MKKVCHKFQVAFEIDPEVVWEQLSNAGIEILFSSTNEDGATEIFGTIPSNISVDGLRNKNIKSIVSATLPEIDWEQQWSIHGNDYHDGFVHIDLKDFGFKNSTSLKLLPGAGFGDLSHPTTRLMLKMMVGRVKNKNVIDVGCGSGVLSVCAIEMGAKEVYSIDIDPQAMEHTKQNAIVNGMEKQVHCEIPNDLRKKYIALMNMIASEQVGAWKSLQQIHPKVNEIITSGILKKDRKSYLKQCENWNWKLMDELEEGEWIAFYFVIN